MISLKIGNISEDMMIGRKNGKVFALVIALALPQLTLAGSTKVVSHINRVLVSGSNDLGGCMVLVNDRVPLSQCSSGWVSLSCSGDFNQAQNAWRMLDQAQLSIAADKRVLIQITDDYKHNGYCVATRLDVYR